MTTQVAYLAPIDDACETLGLNTSQVARVLGANESTLHRWRKCEKEPSPVFLMRIEALEEFLDVVKRTIQPGYIRGWINTPIPALDEKTPIALLLEGKTEKLTGLLVALNSGMSL